MFCPNCGKKADDNALFCGECGTKFEVKAEKKEQDNTVSSETNNTQNNAGAVQTESIIEKFKKLDIKGKIILFEAIVLVIALVWVNQYIDKNNTPVKSVEGFMNSLSNGDYEKAYEYCDLPDSEFVTKEKVVKKLETGLGNLDWSDVKKLDINKGTKSDGQTKVSVAVVDEDGNSDIFGNFYVEKSGKKSLILDSYKIDVESMIIEDYKIYVPNEAQVTFDGINLDDKYISKIDKENQDYYENMTLYEIPYVIAGEYDIVVKLGDVGCKEDKAYTSDGSYYCSSVNVSEDQLKKVHDQAYNDFETIMKAAAEHKKVSEIKGLFIKDEESDVESYYKDLCDAFDLSEGEGLYEVNFSSIDITASSLSGSSTMGINVNISYKFDYKGAQSDWWTGNIEEIENSNYENRSFEYKYVDGKWLIDDAYYALNKINY